ncbi:MAG: YkgJ family cysteine cluster protein [Marinagarivorans sp.]|nr:YkgJ family cysteine cluster protein [Marinagarivorans sp.]
MSDVSPCLSCGACCGFFRVSFYWGECQSAGGIVPDNLTVQVNSQRVCMEGTESSASPTRCRSLMGTIGGEVRCTIYENRPSPCREFQMHGEYGEANDDCNRARAAYGLPPLDIPDA